MKNKTNFTLLLLLATLPASADIISGTTSATWTTGGTNRWEYASSHDLLGTHTSDVTFEGTTFGPGSTPLKNVDLGEILLNNGALYDGRHNYDNTLLFTANFSAPAGALLQYTFPLLVKASSDCLGVCDVLVQLPASGTQSVTVGNIIYTLSLDGFYAGPGERHQVTELKSSTGSTVTAHLYGDFTSAVAPVPEPASITLSATVLAGIALMISRRKRASRK